VLYVHDRGLETLTGHHLDGEPIGCLDPAHGDPPPIPPHLFDLVPSHFRTLSWRRAGRPARELQAAWSRLARLAHAARSGFYAEGRGNGRVVAVFGQLTMGDPSILLAASTHPAV
jgi:hypothetical protein